MAKKKTTVDITPLADRVLIREEEKEAEEETTAAGIIIPESVGDDDSRGATRGEVVAVGEGARVDGELEPMPVSAGQMVLFSWGEKLTIDEVDYHIVEAGNILAIVG